MTEVPPEPASWSEDVDPDEAARTLREGLAHAKARMQEHRDQMHAAGLTKSGEATTPES